MADDVRDGGGFAMMWYGSWGFWPAGGLLGLLVVVLLVVGIVSRVAFLTRASRHAAPSAMPRHRQLTSRSTSSASGSRGEIDQTEFEERRRALGV